MKTLIPREQLDQVARRFRLLGDPVRLEILNLLHVRGEMTVQDLVEATGQSQANVSKHLRLLREAGLVARRQEGPYAYYRINDPMLAALCVLVCSQVPEAAAQ
ncbi:ArsR/SmtB family transcription factor [Rhodothermus marinus]|uniref:ArsR/SmtB family transcription factor n=1 Tax=Rhodothermus marinus TaxID=29549 RepID=UPI0012BA477F|nr:metalloregulator ArsR/SmtB family transcription factor [Rhodothermus marinus]BBM68424.1 transcriptional regulator [Rhodothermus marinus]BBM71393.1 transcriptional regulator [Rhodothermus marinus]